MYTIGEFSKLTGLSVRTLRFYHDKKILIPATVDSDTGYRFYDERNLETARVIVALRDLDFSLEDVGEIITRYDDDGDILDWLDRQKRELTNRLTHTQDLLQRIEGVIHTEREARQLDIKDASTYQIQEQILEPQLVGGIRVKGKYSECSQVFPKLGRQLGRYIAGKPLCLFYDDEYRDEDADFEPCMPLRKQVAKEGIDVRELPGGRCLSLIHRGPYQKLSRSYSRLLRYIKQNEHQGQLPSREVYLKGPGMIFQGNPKKYLTEIQILIAD